MKGAKNGRIRFYVLLGISVLLVIGGVVMLVQTFAQYNDLALTQQDDQMWEMANATDENIAFQLSNLRQDLKYVLSRRGFVNAEETWAESGDTEDLLFRMQENLASQNALTHGMLAFDGEEIFLSTSGSPGSPGGVHYSFPIGTHTPSAPCFAGDGSMHIALFEETERARYAVLIDAQKLYATLSKVYNVGQTRLLLLGTHGNLLLHQWTGSPAVMALQELNEENCDHQAVRYMLESRNTGMRLSCSYNLVYPGESFVHEMRMTVIPAEMSENGYFTLALVSDYDEIIRPMHGALIRLIIYGSIVVLGALLAVLMTLQAVRQSRQQDQELRLLKEKNAEAQRLVERMQELAHHQRLETIGTMASSIAHEFNNLLTPIMGYSILTLEGLPEGADDLADNVTEIYEASLKAKTIISRMSELTHRNGGNDFRRLSLRALSLKALEVATPAKPAHVDAAVQTEGCEGWISGNETQLSQMLLNLILNAFHAMEKEGGLLTISVVEAADAVLLRVTDSGEGIPEHVLPHIFDPFFTTKESGKGTGLGLAIVHQVVENHQGTIEAVSGGGQTVFTVHFPPAGSCEP